MPSPSTTAPAMGPAAFPATGRYSAAGAPAPSSVTGGAVGQTQVTRLVSTAWARAAVDSAAASYLGSSGSLSCAAVAAAAGSDSGDGGSALQNPSGSYAEPTLGAGSTGYFDLAASGAVVSSVQSGLLASAATLGVVTALQSVAGGYAELQANAASTSFQLAEAAAATTDPAAAVAALRAAAQIAQLAASAAPLFSSVLQMAASGLLAAGSAIIGKVLSGALGAIQAAAGEAASVLGPIPAELVALGSGAAALSASVESILGSAPVLPTGATATQLLSLFPASATGAIGGALPVAQAMAALDASAIASVNSIIAAVAPAAPAATAGPASVPSPNAGTAPRTQYLQIVDGIPPIPGQQTGTTADPATAAAQALQAALQALLGEGGSSSSGTPLGTTASGLGSPGTYAPGSLGTSGLFSVGGVTSRGSVSDSGASGASLAAATSVAAAIGANPPAVGDLQSAGFAATSGAATVAGGTSVSSPGGTVSSLASDPAAAVATAGEMLADGCAFGAALASAASQAASLVLQAGAVTADVVASIDSLQATLQCRSASYSAIACGAYAAARVSAARYQMLLGACGILGAYAGIVPAACPAGTGPLGTCS